MATVRRLPGAPPAPPVTLMWVCSSMADRRETTSLVCSGTGRPGTIPVSPPSASARAMTETACGPWTARCARLPLRSATSRPR